VSWVYNDDHKEEGQFMMRKMNFIEQEHIKQREKHYRIIRK